MVEAGVDLLTGVTFVNPQDSGVKRIPLFDNREKMPPCQSSGISSCEF
jgi:hypothetical protein